jgi:HlyD family secretion protein
VEPQRIVPARLSAGHRLRNLALTGVPVDPRLRRIVDRDARAIGVPPAGLVLSRQLAEVLEVQAGDPVTVEVLEGQRPILELEVTGLVDDVLGISAYMNMEALHDVMRESDVISGAALLVDPAAEDALSAAVDSARGSLGQAQAERARTQATLDRARSALQRQQRLAEAGVISRDDLEAAQTTLRAAEEVHKAAAFNVTVAQAQLDAARARLQRPDAGTRAVDVVSPIDGVVLKRFRESETVVPAGEPLVEVGDPAGIEVVADLLSTDAVRVSAGDPVLIEQWGGGHALQGRVQRVEPSGFMKVSALGVEEQRVNVIVDFADPATASRLLGDGYRVEVRVVEAQVENALTVPIGSLFRRGEEWAVFIVGDDGRARVQQVELGQRTALSRK